MCPPGSYSHTGLVPCTQCAVGSYQPQRQKQTCTPCPQGYMTAKTGSVVSEDCDVVLAGQVSMETRPSDVLFSLDTTGTKQIKTEALFSTAPTNFKSLLSSSFVNSN